MENADHGFVRELTDSELESVGGGIWIIEFPPMPPLPDPNPIPIFRSVES